MCSMCEPARNKYAVDEQAYAELQETAQDGRNRLIADRDFVIHSAQSESWASSSVTSPPFVTINEPFDDGEQDIQWFSNLETKFSFIFFMLNHAKTPLKSKKQTKKEKRNDWN